jgi:hypothetical protein
MHRGRGRLTLTEPHGDFLFSRPGGAALRDRLGHVYWIGGGSGAGKSTIARRLAARHGLHLYATDEVMPDHARRSTVADSPLLAGFAAMDMDTRWVSRSPETMLETGCSPNVSGRKLRVSACASSR